LDALTILKSYIDDLQHHDWYYNFSDDHKAWMLGSATESKLLSAAKSIDPEVQVWNTIEPEQFMDGKNG